MTKPTDSELEIMQILWEHGPLTVRQVNEEMNRYRKVGYTTTLKIMQIMADKKLLSRDTASRSHIYAPEISPEEVQTDVLNHILKTVFRGNNSSLIMQALGNHRVSESELEQIKRLIQKMEGNGDGIR